VFTATVTGADTVVRDASLRPGNPYRYRAYWLKNSDFADSSALLTLTTMDTTSHNFTWVIDTLGNYGSYLNDVAIIDENNIWVVGNIETDSGEFNAAHWDGSEWELELIGVPGVIVEGIFYIDEDDIWVATGIIYHWNGVEWERFHLWDMGVLGPDDGGVSKIWGSGYNNLYFVGRKGTIVHYDGTAFTRMESGTDIDLTDVWGIVDDQTGEMQVWVCGDEDNPDRSIVLALNDDTWQTVYERYPYGGGNSIDDQIYFTPKTATLWTAAGAGQIWVGGGWGIYTLNDPLAPTAYDYIDIETEVGYFSLPWRLRGTGENDLLVVG
jgi:hypothetical protein